MGGEGKGGVLQATTVEECRGEGEEEQPIYEGPGPRGPFKGGDEESWIRAVWDRSTITAHFPPDCETAEAAVAAAAAAVGLGERHLRTSAASGRSAAAAQRTAALTAGSAGGGALAVGRWEAPRKLKRQLLFAAVVEQYDVASALRIAQDVLQFPLSYDTEDVQDADWEAQVKASFVPVQVDTDLWIVPEWSEIPDPSATNITLQPGLAFGTGDHPTTTMCLRHLHTMDLEGRTIMDYGTGSGILAILALLKGASQAVATDVDIVAVRAARENAQRNAVEQSFLALQCGAQLDDPEPLQKEGCPKREFDVTVANILQGPLLDLRPRLTAYTRPGGSIALSGILIEQAEEVMAAYSEGFEDLSYVSLDGWALVTGQRRR